MDRVTQDENAYQADLAKREERVIELKECRIFKARVRAVCEELLNDDPESPSVTLAYGQVITVCQRAYSAMVEGSTNLFTSIKDCTLKQMIVDTMTLSAIDHEDDIFDIVIQEFM